MVLNTLLVDVFVVKPSGEVAGPGYVRVTGGTISHIGIGEPPEEAQIAELVLGGPNRLLYPGFAAFVYPETYIIRDYFVLEQGLPGEAVLGCIQDMSEEEAYYASLMAFYELSLAGYSRIIAVTPHVEAVARAFRDAGLAGAILAPLMDSRKAPKVLDWLSKANTMGLNVGVLLYDEELVGELRRGKLLCSVKDNCVVSCNGVNLVAFGCSGSGLVAQIYPTITPSQVIQSYGEQGFRSLVVGLHKLVDKEYEALVAGGKAHISVYDVSEPPSWIGNLEEAGPFILTPLARVETLISEGRLVIDNGEHLLLGPESAENAARALRSVRKRCRPS